MSKKVADTDEQTPAVNGWKKHSRRQLRKQGMVNFRYLDHPPHRVRTVVIYLLIGVAAFWLLHYVMKVG